MDNWLRKENVEEQVDEECYDAQPESECRTERKELRTCDGREKIVEDAKIEEMETGELHAGSRNEQEEEVVRTFIERETAANQDVQGEDKSIVEVVELLLGASIGLANNEGVTPLMVASYQGHSEVVEMLLRKGANVDKRHPDQFTALHVACENGGVNAAEVLLKVCATVDARDGDGHTWLRIAAMYGHINVVELLLERGASIGLAIEIG